MAARWPWIERTFRFDGPVEKFPDVLARYRGAPARVEEVTRGLAREDLVWRDEAAAWSIQENIGHLTDLEALWEKRITEFLAGAERLSAADMSNEATRRAAHNARAIEDVLAGFRRARGSLVERLEAISDADWARRSIHPRLGQSMRLVDAVEFSCAHDDYHIARVHELARARARRR